MKLICLGYKNYILSNNFPELPLVIEELKLLVYFDDYVVSSNVGYEKPRLELFQFALSVANFPDYCYMIGDNPIADIIGGKSAGMKTIFVHKDCNSDADYTCKKLSEIPALLER
jgi:putative hydrolase of the HAD superfamily